jgi:predicted MFS family arabinose efflux permease
MLPALVPQEQLVTANALAGQVTNTSRLAGSALGGVIAAAGGISAVALADAASFVISAALIALIRPARPAGTAAAPAAPGQRQAAGGTSRRGGLAGLREELADGLRLSARHRVLRSLMLCILVVSVGEGVMSTLFAPFVRHVLDGSSEAYGVIASVQALGGIAGGFLVARAGQRMSAGRMLVYGAVAFGAVDLGIFLYPLGYVAVWPAAAGMAVAGVPGAMLIAGAMTLFQRSTEDSHRGRVFGALGAVEGVAILAGTAAAGVLAQLAGIIPALAVQGGGYVIAGLAVLAVLRDDTGEAAARAAVRRQARTAASAARCG